MQGLAFRAARCCDTQVPRDDKDAGDHHSNQDPGTGGEKYICDIHSDFPFDFEFDWENKNLAKQFARR